MSSIELKSVEKWFGPLQVIKGVDLAIEEGEFIIFVGPSGCGKSTLLRMIAGLEETSRGQIMIDSRDATAEPPSKRGLAMVFQSYALYPHMSVRENMGFSLKAAGAPKSEIDEKELANMYRPKIRFQKHERNKKLIITTRKAASTTADVDAVGRGPEVAEGEREPEIDRDERLVAHPERRPVLRRHPPDAA